MLAVGKNSAVLVIKTDCMGWLVKLAGYKNLHMPSAEFEYVLLGPVVGAGGQQRPMHRTGSLIGPPE